MPFKACSVRKSKQLANNKHMDDSKKATRADLVTIKSPQDSGITIINRNWHIVVDQYAGCRESDFILQRVTLWS